MSLAHDHGRQLARLLAGLAALALAPAAAAQDTHYWSIAYGPVGQLVGGQVIAGSRDLSATFYNPGALSMDEQGSFLLSTESVQVETMSLTPTAGLEIFDTSTSRFGAAPSLVAGSLPRWLGRSTRLAWSFLTRQEFKARLGRRLTDPLPPPISKSAAESYFDQSVNESWAGFTASRRFSERWGLGLTWYGVYRGQRNRTELSVQGVAEGGASIGVLGVSEFDYHHFRTLAKLGAAYHKESLQLGLSVTTPSVGLFGTGEMAYTRSATSVGASPGGPPPTAALDTRTEEALETTYRSSWAVGVGAVWRRGATRLHGSVEWFAPVDGFTVLALPGREDEPAEGLALTQQLASVFNAGVGMEHDFGNDVALYAAFRTDFSASVGDPAANAAISDWNLYHASAGVSFRIADSRFTLGGTWSFGGKTRPLYAPLGLEELPGAGLDADAAFRYRRLVLLLGFLFGG